MAGVGFELKKLFTARTAAGHIKAYSYSAIITAGPFALMTSMVLAVQSLFAYYGVEGEAAQIFVASVVYAFVFSQIFSAGFVMVLTRYLADSLSLGRFSDATASLFGMGAILTSLGAVAAGIFFWDKPLPLLTKWLGYLFFAELLLAWTERRRRPRSWEWWPRCRHKRSFEVASLLGLVCPIIIEIIYYVNR